MFKWASQLLGQKKESLAEVESARQTLQVKLQAPPIDALQNASAWLICLNHESQLPPLTRLQLIDWAQAEVLPIIQTIESEFLLSPSSNRVDTQSQWQAIVDFYQDSMLAYQTIIEEWQSTGTFHKISKTSIALTCCRFFRLARLLLKWYWVRHHAVNADFWSRTSAMWVLVEGEQIQLLFVPQLDHAVDTNCLREWLSVLVLQVSAPDSLNAIQVCALEHIIAKVSSAFVCQAQADVNTPFYCQLSQASAPIRLVKGVEHDFTLRYFGAVSCLPLLQGIKRLITTPNKNHTPIFPEQLSLPASDYLTVLEHCNRQWQPQAVSMREARHVVTQRLQIMHGLKDITALVKRQNLELKEGQHSSEDYFSQSHHSLIENWQVENVSLHGVGARIPFSKRPWVEVGALVAVKTEQTSWWVGAIRRLYTDEDNSFVVGIETLSTAPKAWSLKPIESPLPCDETPVLDEHLTGYATLEVIFLEEKEGGGLSCICQADAMCVDGLYSHAEHPYLGIYRVTNIFAQNNVFWCVELQKEL